MPPSTMFCKGIDLHEHILLNHSLHTTQERALGHWYQTRRITHKVPYYLRHESGLLCTERHFGRLY